MARKVERGGGKSEAGELAGALSGLRKKFGEASLTTGSQILQPSRIPTGIFTLDFCTLGGIPMNRISMIVGERHSGKTLTASKVIAGVQSVLPDQQAVLLDIEGAYDPVWAGKLGVDSDSLLVFQPETGESAVDAVDVLLHTREVSLLVIDSIAALTPMKEIEDSAEDAHVGIQARLVGNMIRKCTQGLINERKRGHEVTILFINQYRSKIGGYSPFGEAKSIPGGKALEFSTSLQVVMKNKENQGKDARGNDSVVENEHAFTVTKNKLNGGMRTGEFRVRRVPHETEGLLEGYIDDDATMLAFAKKFGAYTGGGSSWLLEFWDESHRVRGQAEAIAILRENYDLKWQLRNYLIHEQAKTLGMPDYFLETFL